MIIDGQKVYLFNPWQIKRWTEDEICSQVNELIKMYNSEADTMYELSRDIEIISDIQYLYGEMISRLTDEVAGMKLRNDSAEDKATVRARKNWILDHPGEKIPAMSYFEAEGRDAIQEARDKQNEKNSDLTRFKYAYDSMESKMNALKKRQESIKYEEFNK